MKKTEKHIILVLFFAMGVSHAFGQDKTAFVLGKDDAIIYDLAYLPRKGALAASLGDEIQIWNRLSKTMTASWVAKNVSTLLWMEERLIGGTSDGQIFVWDVNTGAVLGHEKVSDAAIMGLAAVDSVVAAAGCESGQIVLWNSASFAKAKTIETGRPVTALIVHVDEIIAGDPSGNITRWNLSTGQMIYKLHGHRSWIRCLQVSEDGTKLLSAADDGQLKIWAFGNESRMLQMQVQRMKTWILSAGFAQPPGKVAMIRAAGQRNGVLKILTQFGNYKYNSHAMINKIIIFNEDLPAINMAMATHGAGVQIVSGKELAATGAK